MRVNPHEAPVTSLIQLTRSLWCHRELIMRMTKREVIGRYKGSIMGIMWSFINPLFMLSVYTFVFSVVFKARWGTNGGENKAQFAMVLFVGMIVHGLFAEVLNRAPSLIVSNVNFVKKVLFPLEVLPVVTMAASLFQAFVNLVVLQIAYLLFNGSINWTVVFIPIVLLPLVLVTLGFGWIMASLGVFLRDVEQTMVIVTMVMMFLSPVFYPLSALPENLRPWIMANPLTFIIEQSRDVLIWGRQPDLLGITAYTFVATGVVWLGYAWFQKTRQGFADVL